MQLLLGENILVPGAQRNTSLTNFITSFVAASKCFPPVYKPLARTPEPHPARADAPEEGGRC